MKKEILVNVEPEETRMALLVDDVLTEFLVERPETAHIVGNIYKGKVQNVLPGMQAAFVDIGRKKNAFLYIGDGAIPSGLGRQGKITMGMTLPVQISKDSLGAKGPRATLHIALPGRDVVLLPVAPYIAISRRITDPIERERLQKLAKEVVPQGMGLIVRTAARGKSATDMQADVQRLVKLWEVLREKERRAKAPALLYRDADLVIRIARDFFTEDISALMVDDGEAYQRMKELMHILAPQLANRMRLYDGQQSLFRTWGIEAALEQLGEREVPLPSGGAIVIDRTEALTAIDVNTKTYVGKENLADTAFRTNWEAAAEILRQMRLRDIGGIILADFIDMDAPQQREKLLAFLRAEASKDRTKTTIVDMTPLGLVEMTRKKSRQNLEGIVYEECPYCHGRGRVESAETLAIRIARDIRRIERASHAANCYEVEIPELLAKAVEEAPAWQRLRAVLKVDVHLTPRAGLHPESYAILAQSEKG